MLLALCLATAVATMQTVPGAILIDRNRPDRRPPVTTPSKRAPVKPAATVTQAALPGTPIKGIRFAGARAPAPVAAAARGFIGRLTTQQTLAELAAALSAAYGDSDVALYTVAIPDQDFAAGIVQVGLTEGRIATVTVDSSTGEHPLLRRRLTRMTREKPLSRATFERQLTLARAIPGLIITPDIKDPNASGALTLSVVPKQRRTKLSAGFSNRGVESLGAGQFDVTGEAYGVATNGDAVSFSASTATNLKAYRYASASYAAPLTTEGLTISSSVAYLETRPGRVRITGEARQAAMNLSYPVVRTFTRSVDASLGVDALNSDNAAFGTVIASERTRAVRAAASFADAKPRRSLSASASLSRSLGGFGARSIAGESDTGYTKVAVSGGFAQAIGSRVTARLSASGQYSRNRLPAAERFAIGGDAIGRAFDTALLTGDRGGGGLAELAVRPLKGATFQASELYGFVDHGSITILSRGLVPTRSFDIGSAGAGVRARFREKAELGFEVAHVLDDPFPDYRGTWRGTVSWRLTL